MPTLVSLFMWGHKHDLPYLSRGASAGVGWAVGCQEAVAAHGALASGRPDPDAEAVFTARHATAEDPSAQNGERLIATRLTHSQGMCIAR